MPTKSIDNCVGALLDMYSSDKKLFSFSSVLRSGKIVNDFTNPSTVRYTINSLLGLSQVPSHWLRGFDVEKETAAFMAQNSTSIVNAGDQGLLLHLLSVSAMESDSIRRAVLQRVRADGEIGRLTLQEVCWILSGLSSSADLTGDEESLEAARQVAETIEKSFLNRDTLLPFHQASGLRRRFVSFGGISYFLMALTSYSSLAGNEYLATVAREATRRVIDLQGPDGEWAWFYDADRGVIVDWYEVYSVHQLSMAQLFLLPQHNLGLDEAAPAISRGTSWALGNNQLDERMIYDEPFFTHRSIRRKGPATRARRLAGAWIRTGTRLGARPAPKWSLEVNPECRSYELGWFLYAWAPIAELPGTEDLLRLK